MIGESLEQGFCVTKNHVYASLMHECTKLYDKQQPNLVKAKRYEIHLNVYDLFESKAKGVKVQLYSLSEFFTSNDYSSRNLCIDVRSLSDGNLLLIYSKEGSNSTPSNRYDYDYERSCFKRDIKTEKGALLYDPNSNGVVKKFSTILKKETNVEKLLFSNGNFIIDDFWNLYDLTNGSLIRNLKKNEPNLELDFSLTRFIFDGRYIITCSADKKQIFVLRCYDSAKVASLWLNDNITCLKLGELDRTIVLGTSNGFVLPVKLVIDLEHSEAVLKYIKFYRNTNITQNKSNQNFFKNTDSQSIREDLKNDIKRVVHSAHAHRQLKLKESEMSSSLLSQSSVISSKISKASDFHIGVAKLNLSNITNGIKYSETSGSRACVIQ